MKVKELCQVCNNLTPLVQVKVITSGEESYVGILDNVFDDISDRLVQWFAVRGDEIIIKLREV